MFKEYSSGNIAINIAILTTILWLVALDHELLNHDSECEPVYGSSASSLNSLNLIFKIRIIISILQGCSELQAYVSSCVQCLTHSKNSINTK